MSKINILDESIYNKISAGEVVERPASVVKELLDNSIDAGATNITISILDGGIKNITISDNGSGIEPDDFERVFVSHATSKIKSEKDLEKIGTLGFRGEALASIASVSKVVLTSKIATETFARTCTVEGGKQSETTEIGAEDGTVMSVSDLFFNVPARAKFLKKPKSEMQEITNLVERYILCNPHIVFKYVADGKLIYQSTGTNLFDAIYVIYGKQATDGIIKVEGYNQNSEIFVEGYIGLPTFSKPNRTYQTLSINGRYVASQLVSTCVYNAYEHYLMKGQFPFFVINLNIPLDKLDVNVHPNKMEVRFNNSNEIYGAVFNAVSYALLSADKITSPRDFVGEYKEVSGGSSFSLHSAENTDKNSAMQTKVIEIEASNLDKNYFKFNDITTQNEQNQNQNQSRIEENSNIYGDNRFLNELIADRQKSGNVFHESSNDLLTKMMLNRLSNNKNDEDFKYFSNEKKNENSQSSQLQLDETSLGLQNQSDESNKTKTQEFFENSDVKFVGQIFSLFLIVEKQDKVYIIDEHAGHERLLFDRLVKEVDSRVVTKQHLLAPYTFDVNSQEFNFIDENIDKFKDLGFDIVQFGQNTFSVNAVPALLSDIDVKKFFDLVLRDLSNMKSLKQSDLILNKLMQHSCKCAVRAGKILSAGEVNSLIEQMKKEKMQLQCPHGRPVVVELTKTEVEKWFKRIV